MNNIQSDFLELRKLEKSYKSLPQRIMMKKWEECGRDVFKFWDTIEWDGMWLKHDTPEEKRIKDIEREYNKHPFKEFISKESIKFDIHNIY